MDNTKSEVESLKKQLAQARKEQTLMAKAFILGGIASGFLIRWLLKDQQLAISPTVSVAALGAVLGGALYGWLVVSISRWREFNSWKRTEKQRFQEQVLKTSLNQNQQT